MFINKLSNEQLVLSCLIGLLCASVITGEVMHWNSLCDRNCDTQKLQTQPSYTALKNTVSLSVLCTYKQKSFKNVFIERLTSPCWRRCLD